MSESYRNDIFKYAKKQYGTMPEYLWCRHPNYAVLRRSDNNKWYGVVMDVSRSKLGLSGVESVDILNVKCDAGLYDFLRGASGFLRGYHMGGNWISILLDGTVKPSQIFALIDKSYELVGNGKHTAIRASQQI